MARKLDDLAEFDEFADILKSIKLDLKCGMDEKRLREKYAPLCQARAITLALTCRDETLALAAIRDNLDRKEGKPTQKQEVTHHLNELPEEEIDALLLTKLDGIELSKDKNH